MSHTHDPLLSDDVLAAFGDVLAPTGAADTAARIAAMAKRSVDEAAADEARERYAPELADVELMEHADAEDSGPWQLDVAALRAFVRGAEGDLTMVSRRTGSRFTYSLSLPKVAKAGDSRVFVKVHRESGRPAFLGTVWLEASNWRGRTYPPRFKRHDRAEIAEDAPAARAAVWLFDRVARGTDEAILALLGQADLFGEAV